MLVRLAVAFAVMAAVFGLVELRPAASPRRWRDGSVRTDLIYWFFTPLVTRAMSTVALAIALVALARALGMHVGFADLGQVLVAHGPIAREPVWLQGAEALVLADGLGYGIHRMFHGRALWPFHAVHHASEHLDWLSSVRLHPVNEAVTRVVQIVPLVLIGFDPRVLAATAPVFTAYALLLHANVDWSFGPLKYVVATPAFHRWHHAADEAAIDSNFAGLFPFWDILFGTFRLPARTPERFGLAKGRLPEAFLAQLASPFTRGRDGERAA